ncbi:HAD family hydrolase [Bacteroides sp. BFG-551]|nr:HAD family hydrolase [Bacteroides sp. BFG-551]
MLGSEIKLLITDFDGTLVDTFQANFMAYKKAFNQVGLALSEIEYRQCFGFRFDKFMTTVGVTDPFVAQNIREYKSNFYSDFFEYFRVNISLLSMLETFHKAGGKTAIASTAYRKNLENALRYIGAMEIFDFILAGEEVKQGKPSPDIYRTVLNHFSLQPTEALIFEDSEVGIQSAKLVGINYIVINSIFYGN